MNTPETEAAIKAAGGDWSPVLRVVSQRLERQRDEARDELKQWQTLRLYGAEPEYVHEYIRKLRFE